MKLHILLALTVFFSNMSAMQPAQPQDLNTRINNLQTRTRQLSRQLSVLEIEFLYLLHNHAVKPVLQDAFILYASHALELCCPQASMLSTALTFGSIAHVGLTALRLVNPLRKNISSFKRVSLARRNADSQLILLESRSARGG
jgi:hypothetical protein